MHKNFKLLVAMPIFNEELNVLELKRRLSDVFKTVVNNFLIYTKK